jgi:hypothetical protein
MIIGQHHKIGIMISAVTKVQRTADWNKVLVYTGEHEFETYDASEFNSALENTVQASFPAQRRGTACHRAR